MRRTLVRLAACATFTVACNAGERAPALTAGQSGGRMDSLLALGERLFTDEKFDSARTAWAIVRQQTAETRDSSAHARALLSLARLDWQVGQLITSRALAETALVIITRRQMRTEVSTANRVLGLVALDEGRNADAVALSQRALDAAQALGNRADEARAAGNMGLAYAYMGDYARARGAHRQVRMAARAQGDARMEGKALANEAMVDIWEGDPRPAIARLDTARMLYRRSAFATGEEQALGQLATAYELTGEENRAFAALDSALILARRLGMIDEELDELRLLAGLHLRLGDTRRALDVYRDAETRMRQAALTANLGSLLRGSAEANLRLGNLARAEQQLDEALTRHSASAEASDRLDDLLLAVELDQRAGRASRVEQRLREAKAIATTLNARGSRISVALAEAHVADRAGDAARVLRVLAAAGPDMRLGDYGGEWMTDALSSRAFARVGKLDSAVAAGRRSVAAIERLRGALASDALRSSYVMDRADVYGDLVLTLLRLGRTGEAFVVADAARSRELMQQLTVARSDIRSLGGPAELVEAERLLRRIDLLVQRLRATDRDAPRERGERAHGPGAAIAQALAEARAQYDALMVRAAETRSRASAVLGARSAGVEEIQAALGHHEALVEYMIADSSLLTFVVTKKQLRVLRTTIDRESVTQRVWLLRDLWGRQNDDWRDGLAAARALHETLIAPAEASGLLADINRLIVVPLGVVAQVPFAALVAGEEFLIRRYEIVHLPSAAALPAMRREGANVGQGSLSGAAFAPFPRELPATVTEAETFRGSGAGWSARVGDDATESALRRSLETEAVVHVATHGVFNVRSPIFSRLELARPRNATSENDGRLEAHEILGLSIRSRLVFLSGCETGASQGWGDDPVRGTGDLTLAQAVLAAGAPNVIMTLWRIDDLGAAEFARRFYGRLDAGDAAAALAHAQRQMAEDPRYRSPYYWAGYTLSGSGSLRGPQSTAVTSVSRSSQVAGRTTLSRKTP